MGPQDPKRRRDPGNDSGAAKYLVSGCFIIQDEVVQHPEMTRLNPSSLNTIRIDTFKEPVGGRRCCRHSCAWLWEMIVDNIGDGGLYAGVNLEDGTLKQHAIRDIWFNTVDQCSPQNRRAVPGVSDTLF